MIFAIFANKRQKKWENIVLWVVEDLHLGERGNRLKKKVILISVVIFILVCSFIVKGDVTWYSSSFGGSVVVEGEEEQDITWYSSSFGGSVTVEEESSTEMYITGDESTITEYGNFNISVYLDPVEPVRSWEFSLQYNASALNVTSTAEGDFFTKHGYTTLYSGPNVENPANGSLLEMYSVCIAHNTSEAGYLFNITFIPIVSSGVSEVNFNTSVVSFGITNETQYLDFNYTNGTITLDIEDFPEWSDWSAYWKIGQTSLSDMDTDMDVDINDITSVTGHYGETGANGWIIQDYNEDGEIDINDITGVTSRYGDDYT